MLEQNQDHQIIVAIALSSYLKWMNSMIIQLLLVVSEVQQQEQGKIILG